MKFAQKMSCAMILLVAVSFSVGGFLKETAEVSDHTRGQGQSPN